MSTPQLPFFVYGTLLPGEANHGLVQGRITAAAPAVLHGVLLYEGPGYPFAVADPDGAGTVHGALLHPLPELYGRVLADLDALEGYVPGAPGNLYERVVCQAVPQGEGTGEDRRTEAWLYVADPARARELRASARPLPGGRWCPDRRPAVGVQPPHRRPRTM